MASKVTQFILSHFPGVNDIENVNPYAFCGPDAYSVVKEKSVTRNFSASHGPLTLNMQENVLVSPRTIYIRYFKNTNEHSIMHIKRLFSHAAAAEDDAMKDKIADAMGIMPGCVLHIPPKSEGSVSVFVLREHPDSLYLQSAFVKTCLMLNETNVMNGIFTLEGDFHDELPTRATIFDESGEDLSYDIGFYYFIPRNHVLSWCLTVGNIWRQKKGIFALEYIVAPKNSSKSYVLYYLVDNYSFERIRSSFFRQFIHNKIDVRPVNSLGVELINNNIEHDNQPITLTISFTYAEKPQMMDPNSLAPTLDPHFVPYSHILEQEIRSKEVA